MAKFMYGTLWYLQTLHVNVGEGKIMVLNTTYIVAVSFIRGENRGYPANSTDLSQGIDKLYHIMLYREHFAVDGFAVTMVVVIECIGSCKSIYYTIMPTAAPSMHVYVYFHIYT
jgi:hypothetical protein